MRVRVAGKIFLISDKYVTFSAFFDHFMVKIKIHLKIDFVRTMTLALRDLILTLKVSSLDLKFF